MLTVYRSPYDEGDTNDKLDKLCSVKQMAQALAELEAMAWMRDNCIAATLIHAAKEALTDP